jgi:hypothetical protein
MDTSSNSSEEDSSVGSSSEVSSLVYSDRLAPTIIDYRGTSLNDFNNDELLYCMNACLKTIAGDWAYDVYSHNLLVMKDVALICQRDHIQLETINDILRTIHVQLSADNYGRNGRCFTRWYFGDIDGQNVNDDRVWYWIRATFHPTTYYY